MLSFVQSVPSTWSFGWFPNFCYSSDAEVNSSVHSHFLHGWLHLQVTCLNVELRAPREFAVITLLTLHRGVMSIKLCINEWDVLWWLATYLSSFPSILWATWGSNPFGERLAPYIFGWVEGWVAGVHEWTGGWMDEWKEGRSEVWMDRWIDGWVDG